MKKNIVIINFFLFFLSCLICFILAEIGLRLILFSDFNIINDIKILSKQRNPDLYADPYSEDDYWKLSFKLNKMEEKYEKSKNPNEPLKMINNFIPRNSYLHLNAEYIKNRRPVLLYGDSFARCGVRTRKCFEDYLNRDAAFSNDHYLLNYGVGGYGVDQIYLLLKNSINNFKDPFVVISLMTLDLDRSILSFRSAQKPLFVIENNELKLTNNPEHPTLVDLISDNEPDIVSYLYRRIIFSGFSKKIMPHRLISYLKKEEYYKQKKKQLNERILLEIIQELRSRNLEFVFIIFHQPWVRGIGSITKNHVDWRDAFLKNILDKNNIPYIWSKDIISHQINNNLKINELFIPGDGHPTDYLNKVYSESIKKSVLERAYSEQSSN